MSTTRALRSALALAALAFPLAACASDAGTAPSTMTAAGPARAVGTFGSVFNVQLRALPPNPIIPTDPLYGFGNLQVRLGSLVDDSCLPPNPVTPQPGETLLSVCGRIFNEGGALYEAGGIYMAELGGDGSIAIVQFGGTIPSAPCRRYDLGGAVVVSDAIAADMIANPTRYTVNFEGDVSGESTSIGGAFDGSAWGPVGTRPETDPYFSAKVCSVAITP